MKTVSFQGENGAYSQAAALELYPGAKTTPFMTFADAVEAAESEKTECAIVPVENSIAGNVSESYDILRSTSLHIIAETYHRIEHCLIGSCALDEAKTVYSHPQALAQCRSFIESQGLEKIPTYDTSGSVRMIAKMSKDTVCIASKHAAQIHNMPVIRENISDRVNNHTRFIVLAHSDKEGTKEKTKTSIIASLPHKQGSLYSLLGVFANHNINLTRIESRPNGQSSWEYDFIIDLACGPANANEVLDEASKLNVRIKNLGSYPAAVPA